ncbi:MAG: HEAT repeat domain-containing protein [Planctomycetaceae bacterium]|nr:HEAT repeat domain-containing protein [Planctomycetaceae bacterium]
MGPDGAIYIADWYNPIIQHGEVDFRDDRRDHEHGRIWRIAPKNLKVDKKKRPADYNIAELLDTLADSGTTDKAKWWIDAARAELTSRDQKKVISATKKWYQNREKKKLNTPHDLLETLWVLQRWKQTDDAILKAALSSEDHRCRAAAVRILKDFLDKEYALASLENAIQDEHPQVRLEALHALRKLGGPVAIRLAAHAESPENDRFLDFSLWQTFREAESVWLPEVVKNPQWLSSRPEVLLYAAQAIQSSAAVAPVLELWQQGKFTAGQTPAVLAFVAARGEPKHLDLLWKRALNGKISTAETETLLNSLAATAQKRRIKPTVSVEQVNELLKSDSVGTRMVSIKLAGLWKVQSAVKALKQLAADDKQPGNLRAETLRSLAQLGGKENQDYLLAIANGKRIPGLRITAIHALIDMNLPLATRSAVALLQEAPAGLNVDAVLNPFLARKQGPNILAKVLQKASLSAEVATAGVRRSMSLPQKNPGLIAAFQKAGKLDPVKKEMSPEEIKTLVADIVKLGSTARGEAIYRRENLLCLKCHAIGGAGGKVGPDLSSIGASAPIDYLIDSLLLPSKKIKEGYHTVQVVTVDGLVKSGVPLLQNQEEITLRDAEGKVETISMDDVEFIKNSPVSLMVADLTVKLRRDELIDLVRFLASLGKTGELVVSKQRYVRTWQVMVPGGNNAAINDAVRHHGMKHATGDDPLLPWGKAYSHVTGEFVLSPRVFLRNTAGVPVHFMRFEIEVINAGKIGLKFENPEPLIMWVDGKETPVALKVELDLPKGKHRISISSQSQNRSVKIELIDVPGSTGQASLVN